MKAGIPAGLKVQHKQQPYAESCAWSHHEGRWGIPVQKKGSYIRSSAGALPSSSARRRSIGATCWYAAWHKSQVSKVMVCSRCGRFDFGL
jgi:hypothetical protein